MTSPDKPSRLSRPCAVRPRVGRWVSALWLMAAATAVSSAQQAQAPRPAGDPERPMLMIVASGALLAIVLLLAAFLPSKRGHQD